MNDLETLKYIEQAFNKEDTLLFDRVALKQIASYDFGPGFVLGRDSRIIGLSFAGLRNLDLGRIIDDLADLKELRQLNLWQTDLTDIGPLRLLTGLTHLNLGRNRLTDLTPLKDLPLEELCLMGSLTAGEIQGQAIGEWLPSLNTIGDTDLSKLHISDIGVLGTLNKLRKLDLSYNVLNDLAVANRVRELIVRCSWILNFDGFNNFGNIEKLDFSSINVMVHGKLQQLPNIDFLETLPRLLDLNLAYNMLGDITPLKHLRQLTHLQAPYNQIVNVEPLKKLVKLEALSLESNRIESVDLLFNLTELKHLYLSYNFIKKLSPIGKLTNLESLTIARNPVVDWHVLKSFKKLSYLDLSENNIESITMVDGLADINNLQMRKNSISDISPLATITNLTTLDMCSNMVSDLTPLSKLASLRYLRMHRNPVKDISPLLGCGLTTLDLDDRYIEDKELLSQLRSNISENRMREFKAREAAEFNAGIANVEENDEKVVEAAIVRESIKEVVSYTPAETQQLIDKNNSEPKENKVHRIVKIFLASSSELESDRREFEIMINRENNRLVRRNIQLILEIWEDSIEAMSVTRSQDEYNMRVKACDIFVMLFFTRVGKYTDEEFDKAHEQFKAMQKPQIWTYFKKAEVKNFEIKSDQLKSVEDFQKKLIDMGHFQSVYTNIGDLKFQFSGQLREVLDGPEYN